MSAGERCQQSEVHKPSLVQEEKSPAREIDGGGGHVQYPCTASAGGIASDDGPASGDVSKCAHEWQSNTNSRLYWIGYLAGIAGGEIELKTRHKGLQVAAQYGLAIVFSAFSITGSLCVLPLLALDCLHYVAFWILSLAEAYQHFRLRLGRRASIYTPPEDPAKGLRYECDPERWTCDPWTASTPLFDWAFVLCTLSLLTIYTVPAFLPRREWFRRADTFLTPRSHHRFDVPKIYENSPTVRSIQRASTYAAADVQSFMSHVAYFFRGQWLIDHIRLFRQHLAEYPPDFPISCNDQIFGFDETKARFQLCMLFIVDKLSFEDVADAFRGRWISWEPKTRGVVGRRWGRPCWRIKRGNAFDLNNHIVRKRVDLTTTTVAEVVSAMGSEEMPTDQPQWQVWYLETEPTQTDGHSRSPSHESSTAAGATGRISEAPSYKYIQDNTIAVNATDTAKLSYIVGKWSHIYADGSGMMAGIVTRLGDKAVSMADLPENYRRTVPSWQVVLYYLYHGIVASIRGLRIWCYWSFAHPRYPALLQAELGHSHLPHPVTGRKYFSAPGVFDLSDIRTVRRGIEQETGIKPTVNDIFASCIAYAVGQLTDPVELDSVVRTKLNLPPRRKGVRPLQCGFNRQGPNTLPAIIPMMVRTGVPKRMDNFTSLVNVALPLPQRVSSDHLVPTALTTKDRPATPATQPSSPLPQLTSSIRARTTTTDTSPKKARHTEPIASQRCLSPTSPAGSVLLAKAAIDKIKSQRLREALFVMMCCWCKALPTTISSALFKRMYRSVQICSTNVAAPPIESKFFGREVRGLFFWPAVPVTLNIGTSVVSLGSRFQLLTVLDECEILPAIDVARRIFHEERMMFGQEEYQEVLDVMSDVLVSLVVDRFHTLKTTYRHLAISHAQRDED